MNVTFLSSWTYTSSSLNCTFSPNYASTFQNTRYIINCLVPWNITQDAVPFVLPYGLVRGFDISSYPRLTSEYSHAVFYSWLFGIGLILATAALIYVVLYNYWWVERIE